MLLSVALSDDEGETIEVTFDHDSVPNEAVDVSRNGDVVLSCSLAELEEFAEHLISFVEHHRDVMKDGTTPKESDE